MDLEQRDEQDIPTLRDQFAMAALTGFLRLANPLLLENMIKAGYPVEQAPATYAKWAFVQADAMMAERIK